MLQFQILWRAFIITFVVFAAYTDIRWRKIPRTLTVAGFLAGLAVNTYLGLGWKALAASAVAFLISFPLFYLGAIGGGDVKLIVSLAAMLRFSSWASAMWIAILAAFVMALVQVVRRRALRQTLQNTVELLRSFLTRGLRPHPVLNVHNEKMIRSPFAVAAAIGTIVVTFRP
jgi:prepilin peptidase CpaA